MEDKTILEKLCNIQTELKAPKNQRNNFGKYNYRSCEDILEAIKPLLEKFRLVISLSDNVMLVGERYYVQVVATLTDVKTGEHISTTAFAREEEQKKGMDGSQITGTASSYARKYALNGLFAIDDAKDSDYTNTHNNNDTERNRANRTQNKSTITLNMAKDIEVTAGEFKGKTLWEVANEDLSIINNWYMSAKGDRKKALKLILDAMEWKEDE